MAKISTLLQDQNHIFHICHICHFGHIFQAGIFRQIPLENTGGGICHSTLKRSMLHIRWRERSSKMLKASSILGSLSQMICDGIHVSNICIKANRTLGFLRQNLYPCPQVVKEAAYKGLVGPFLEYSGSVWDPSGLGRNIHWTSNYSTGIVFIGNMLSSMSWLSLHNFVWWSLNAHISIISANIWDFFLKSSSWVYYF